MLFPILFLVGAIAFLRGRTVEPGAVPVPPAGEISTRVPAWLGQASGPGGEQLLVRLTRLHGDAERQAFDTASLSRRLELDLDPAEGGEPWRLELRYVTRSEGGESEHAAPLELSGLTIRDEAGIAQRPLSTPEAPAADSVADPLAVLLAPPKVVRAGELARLVLWGREPVGSTELLGCLGEVALHADQVEAEDARFALAELSPAADPGPSVASDGPDDGSEDR